MSKQVTIHVSRRITVTRAGQDPVVLEPGRNVVDEDIAKHQFVKHFLTDEPTAADNGEADALRARVAELEKKIDSQESAHKEFFDAAVIEREAQSKHIQAANAQLNERAKENDDLQQRHDKHAARVADLEEQLAQKTADLDALVASMSAPAEAAAKGKGK